MCLAQKFCCGAAPRAAARSDAAPLDLTALQAKYSRPDSQFRETTYLEASGCIKAARAVAIIECRQPSTGVFTQTFRNNIWSKSGPDFGDLFKFTWISPVEKIGRGCQIRIDDILD